MLANTPHPINRHPIRLLDLAPVLQPSPPLAQEVVNSKLPSLDTLLIAARLGELYETIFPLYPEWLEAIVDWKQDEDIAKAVGHFLNHVAKLFPIEDECWAIDIEFVEWRLYSIPVCPMGFDIWHHGWDELFEPAPYLLHIEWSRAEKANPEERNDFQQLYPNHPVPRRLEPHRLVGALREICAESRSPERSRRGSQRLVLPEPLHGLPDLIEMLNGCTDNLWLDVGELSLMEGGGYPQWDPVEVEMLAEEWENAKPILDRVLALLNWQNETPDANSQKVTAVHEILLEAYRRQEPSYLPQLKMEFAQETSDEQCNSPTLTTTAALAP